MVHSAQLTAVHFHYVYTLHGILLAKMLDSLVRVSRRVNEYDLTKEHKWHGKFPAYEDTLLLAGGIIHCKPHYT